MARRRGLLWLASMCLAAAAGCPGYTSGIRRGADADTRFAYLYGRFYMNAPTNPAYAFGHAQSMGFLIRCQDGSEYVFGSRPKRDIQVLKIRPSRCWLIEAQMVRSGRANSETPPDRTACAATPRFRRRPRLLRRSLRLDDGRDEERVSPLRVAARGRHAADPAAERKRGNGIVAAPGEPPMSPERVAVVAPFIKRNYGSPAECEAACPAGQCLPYRADSGPAMACVIRCDSDADCPAGLACNCPNSERNAGPGCRPIATAPGDPMARICLSVEAAGQRR